VIDGGLVDVSRDTAIYGLMVVELFLYAALLLFLIGKVLGVLLQLTLPVVDKGDSSNQESSSMLVFVFLDGCKK
jgi:hypothetical protein